MISNQIEEKIIVISNLGIELNENGDYQDISLKENDAGGNYTGKK